MQNKGYGKLYLIPNFLSVENPHNFLADYVRDSVKHITKFIVESEKGGRALIKKLGTDIALPDAELFLLNEHSNKNETYKLLDILKNDTDAAIISDAGLPCIADPGSDLVALAQQKNIEVIPLPGASSIFMALMASGFSGQSFVFYGYLPIEKPLRVKKIKEMEKDAISKNQSQIFMEAPYRNNQLLEDILKTVAPNTRICIACNISSPDSWIKTKSAKEWMTQKPELHKRPVIFVMGA